MVSSCNFLFGTIYAVTALEAQSEAFNQLSTDDLASKVCIHDPQNLASPKINTNGSEFVCSLLF